MTDQATACEYPDCPNEATAGRALVIDPEPIMVSLCPEHLAVVDANSRTPETADFWRWFDAMSGMTG